ncbi:2-dehydropantoate 2-reductase [Psychrobacillus sp.]|uniref:ketopantoate reductase family protein n=1 Tax=Psychrobacillus sp. TaxID=1871623 RepID=UPI0028BED2D4|nr:2-dehydropantoate 2-reductase [Psychrobacillus sp.]
MKIGIVGAGAVGMLFGAYLAEAAHDITFLVREKTQQELYIEKESNAAEMILCKQVNDFQQLHSMDLIIIAVKYHHLAQLKVQLDLLPVHIPLLFIQNGLLHQNFIQQLNQQTIVLGSVLHGATKINASTVRHLGVGTTSIGVVKGNWELQDTFLASASTNFPIEWAANIDQLLFRKALLNCLINPLTTIAKVPNGDLIENESYQSIIKNIYEELMGVFEEWKIRLTWDEVTTLCKNTKHNRSSMLNDYENGRIMESDTIVGAVLLEADKRNKTLPILQTFYLLLKEMNKVGDQNY